MIPSGQVAYGDHGVTVTPGMHWPSGKPFEVGEHICVSTPRGPRWGRIVRVGTGRITTILFSAMDDPGRQDFPEWKAADRFRRLAVLLAAEGCDVHDGSCTPGP